MFKKKLTLTSESIALTFFNFHIQQHEISCIPSCSSKLHDGFMFLVRQRNHFRCSFKSFLGTLKTKIKEESL